MPLNATQPVPGWQGSNQPPDYRSDGAGSCICARLLRETAKTCKSGEAEFKLTVVLAQYSFLVLCCIKNGKLSYLVPWEFPSFLELLLSNSACGRSQWVRVWCPDVCETYLSHK